MINTTPQIIPPKPYDSKIEISSGNGQTTIRWKNSNHLKKRFFFIFLFLIWFTIWALGLTWNGERIFSGADDWFPILWFVIWTTGGVFPVWMLVSLFKSVKPEILILDSEFLTYQSGTRFVQTGEREYQFENAGKPQRLQKSEIGIIVFENSDLHTLIAIYQGTKRIGIGESLSEAEREWLMTVLRNWKKS